MQLIKLSANQKSFKTVNFKQGMNFILGKRSNPDVEDLQKTFNGVGKSLVIQLIHYCLASEKIDDFSRKLPDWEFYLEFQIGSEKHISSRSTNNQNKIKLNEKEMSLDEFKEILRKEIFRLEDNIPYLTFRTLISRFIRPTKGSYLAFDKYISQERDYGRLLNNAYLLGLDISKAIRKYELKQELDRVDLIRQNIEKDETFNRFFLNGQEVDIEIFDLNEQAKRLEKALAGFNVAEDFYKIQQDVETLKQKMQVIKNKLALADSSIRYIKRSLSSKADITEDVLFKMYEEANVSMPDAVKKRVNEVAEFHKNLIQNRNQRLGEELNQFVEEKRENTLEFKKLARELDRNLKYLGEHGALEDFIGLNNKLAGLKSRLEKLNSYKELMQEYKKRSEEIKITFGQENIETNEYLETVAKPIIEKNMTTYRQLSKEFYENRPGGIEIGNNENINTIRYKINARLEDDASDGINEVKIFCFDLTVLLTQHNHNMNFIVHDSRLFSNMDPRQASTLFRLAFSYTNNTNRQYIATVNENMLTPLNDIYSDEDYKSIIDDNIILELTDESEKSKLLGIQIDMDYEKE